jgi:hypothetical protein
MLRLPAMLSRIVILLGAGTLGRKNDTMADTVDKILSTKSLLLGRPSGR